MVAFIRLRKEDIKSMNYFGVIFSRFQMQNRQPLSVFMWLCHLSGNFSEKIVNLKIITLIETGSRKMIWCIQLHACIVSERKKCHIPISSGCKVISNLSAAVILKKYFTGKQYRFFVKFQCGFLRKNDLTETGLQRWFTAFNYMYV